jgi:deoxyribose-phosphate aldolase
MTTVLPTLTEISKTIDHALLKPDMTRSEVHAGLILARKYDVKTVCVRPSDVSYAHEVLATSNVLVGTVVGFPHGSSTVGTKVFETIEAVEAGAAEIDFVLNISNLRSGFAQEVTAEMRAITQAAHEHGAEIVKVIFETAYLSDEQVKLAAELAEHAGVDFIKTSTGFASEGATLHNLRIMREAVGDHIQVKASGGVRDLDTLLEMKALGVTRFGTSATKEILDDLQSRIETGKKKAGNYTEAY